MLNSWVGEGMWVVARAKIFIGTGLRAPPTKAATKHAQLLLVQTLHHLSGENRTSLLATEACMQAVYMVQGAQAWWSLCCS